MQSHRLYRDLAYVYDRVYSDKEYEAEAKELKKVIAEFKQSDGQELLEAACGTGRFLELLQDDFHCMGIDLHVPMLRIARKRVPNVRLKQADMISMELGKKFDVILCLFSSIAYVRTESKLRRTMRTFAQHLKPGGIAIVQSFFTPDQYIVGKPHLAAYQGKDMLVARMNTARKRGKLAVFNFHYLIAEPGKDVRHVVDHHELALFEHRTMLTAMKAAGLRAKHLNPRERHRRGMYVGIKPVSWLQR